MKNILIWAAGIAALAGVAYLVAKQMKADKDDKKAIPPTGATTATTPTLSWPEGDI